MWVISWIDWIARIGRISRIVRIAGYLWMLVNCENCGIINWGNYGIKLFWTSFCTIILLKIKNIIIVGIMDSRLVCMISFGIIVVMIYGCELWIT